jgi:hypothetical protein
VRASPVESCKALCNFIRSARRCFVSCVFHSFVFRSYAHGLHLLARSLPSHNNQLVLVYDLLMDLNLVELWCIPDSKVGNSMSFQVSLNGRIGWYCQF